MSPKTVPVSWDEQVQKAIDCFEAAAPQARLSPRLPRRREPDVSS